MRRFYTLIFSLFFTMLFSQKSFRVKVEVVDRYSYEPIKDAVVEVEGKQVYYSFIKGYYEVDARPGDQLVVELPGFETVYHTIQNNEAIKILVEKESAKEKAKANVSRGLESKSYKSFKKIRKPDLFDQFLDSAKFYSQKDLDKSLSFIEKTLREELTPFRKVASFNLLGDVYLHWKQFDLAIENYEASLDEVSNEKIRLQLAKALFLNKDYDKSIQTYQRALSGKLTSYQELIAYEGLGDAYAKTKKYAKAKTNYDRALVIAQENMVTPKITDLNSKIAEVYAQQGATNKADAYYQNSLRLADKENAKRVLKEQHKVADFYNKSRRYDEEIDLRKRSLKNAVDVQTEDKESLVDSITSQKINYKIGNAYYEKKDYDEAIPYLEKSIDDANLKEDLIVEKFATKRLSEVYASVGDFTKALETYQNYVKLVDKSYTQKQQEIQQIKRFSRRIADNQNRIASLEKDKELSETKMNLAYIDHQLTEENNKRQKIIIYALIFGMAFMSVASYLLYKLSSKQKQANNLLALKSMRSQMNPHFIFNALNSVNSFIAVNDERSANRYLSEFSTLMRSVLENSDEDFIPLSKEIELLSLYVKLEHNRFKDKFNYDIHIDDQIPVDDFSIPPMLLQPYIENAIWHGLRYKKEKGVLTIKMTYKDSEEVEIVIIDNGIGRKKSMEMKTKNQLHQKSKGMSTIKNRINILNSMYKDKISVAVTDAKSDGTGTKVVLMLRKIA